MGKTRETHFVLWKILNGAHKIKQGELPGL